MSENAGETARAARSHPESTICLPGPVAGDLLPSGRGTCHWCSTVNIVSPYVYVGPLHSGDTRSFLC